MKSIIERSNEVYSLVNIINRTEMPKEAKVISYKYYIQTFKALRADAKGAIKYSNVVTSEAKKVIGNIMYNLYKTEAKLEELEEKGE